MKLSTRTRYGMRLMIDLAQHWGSGHVALKDIAERQSISKKYLEQIVSPLVTHKLVKATRGFSGGYQLARDPETITAADVVEATESSLSLMECTSDDSVCARSGQCAAQTLWRGLEGSLQTYLRSTSLKELAEAAGAPFAE